MSLRKHFPFWHLPKNDNKSKGSKMQTQETMLKNIEEGSYNIIFHLRQLSQEKRRYLHFKGVFLFARVFLVN